MAAVLYFSDLTDANWLQNGLVRQRCVLSDLGGEKRIVVVVGRMSFSGGSGCGCGFSLTDLANFKLRGSPHSHVICGNCLGNEMWFGRLTRDYAKFNTFGFRLKIRSELGYAVLPSIANSQSLYVWTYAVGLVVR